MRYSHNSVVLIGLVGRDPEVKTLNSGHMVASFGLATTEGYKDKAGEWQNKTTWHDIKCWRKVAEEAGRRIHKGDTVTIIGKLDKESWEKDGVKQYKVSVVCDTFTVQEKGAGSGEKNDAFEGTHEADIY